MTTTCSSWKFAGLGLLCWACATSRPGASPETKTKAASRTFNSAHSHESPVTDERPQLEPFREWMQIARGVGNGHALPNVRLTTVTISTSSQRGKEHYCEQGPVEAGATFGVVEALQLEDDRTLYYIIERVEDGQWRYQVHFDGETSAGSPECATCHEQGKPDPFFRSFRDVACR